MPSDRFTYTLLLCSCTVCPVFLFFSNSRFCILTLGEEEHLALGLAFGPVSLSLHLHHSEDSPPTLFHTDCTLKKKKLKKKKPFRLFLEVQKPIVDIQMDKSTSSTSVFSSGVSNPDPGFCPQGILIPPSTADRPLAPLEGRNQCFNGGMGGKE